MYRFDGSTVLVIKTDVTHTVTHQTTHILPPAGTQNALDESQKKASTQQAARSITLLARCRRAHGARLGRWRSQKHRWWPSAGVSGGGRDLTIRADDPTSRGTTQPGPTTQPNPKSTILKLGPQLDRLEGPGYAARRAELVVQTTESVGRSETGGGGTYRVRILVCDSSGFLGLRRLAG